MYKELIWNAALLSLGIFLILLMTLEISGTSIVPGWRSYPAGLIDKLKLGLLLGFFFIVSRYILLGILNISHPDFRLSVLLLSYLLPILLILLAWHYYMDRVMGSFLGTIMPIEDLKKEVKLLQQAGLFKKHQVDSAEATEIAIGRALVQSHGIIYAEAFVNPANGNIDHERCIELDTDKACNVRNLIETETAGGITSDSKYTAGAVLYILKQASDAFDALKKSVYLGGDVDSLAALTTGILAGRFGVESLPAYMIEAVEGKDYLRKIGEMWDMA